MKDALQEALPGNISEVCNLPRYNLLLARTLDEQWKANAVSDHLVQQMQGLVKDFIEQDQVPKFIKASDLWAAYIEQHEEEAAHEQLDAPQVVIDDERDGYFYIGFEKEPHVESRYGSTRKKDSAIHCDVYLGLRQVTNREDRKDVPVLEDGHPVYSLNWRVVTCSVRSLCSSTRSSKS